MQALQGLVSKLVSSSRIRRLVYAPCYEPCSSHVSGASSLALWLRTISHFSCGDNINGGMNGPMGASDDFSLRQAESGFSNSSNNSNSDMEEHNVQRHPSKEPIPGGSLRDDKSFDQPPPHFQELHNSSRSFPPKFDSDHSRVGGRGKRNKSFQIDFEYRSLTRASETRRDVDASDNSFLENFKLGYDNESSKPSEIPASNQSEEEKLSPDQPTPEAEPQDVDEIFKKLKETGLIPNAVAMIDGLCKDGLVQEAMKLFGLMREKGTLPEIVVYTAVVEGFAKGQKADDAIRIFRKMQKNDISPNAFSYTVLIQGLYKCKRLQDAADFCVEMLEAGHSPNVTTFVGLVDSFCVEKGVEEAQDVIRKLREKGFSVNEKAVREFLDKKAPLSSSVWEAIFGKKTPEGPF
ncbi:hypothetical protein L6164_007140 [Bauhinia variegata]|uniref:Uncharacterized protein n=2 Tax=Bauhinia variegata TaxID=167791 RepID=A0ACB9PX55_BAUVA|nr:hypothetical protein L6164_007140 [Bauhinia variegata]